MTSLIIKAVVRGALKDKNVTSDFYDVLDEEVKELLESAVRRAKQNDRKTVQSYNL